MMNGEWLGWDGVVVQRTPINITWDSMIRGMIRGMIRSMIRSRIMVWRGMHLGEWSNGWLDAIRAVGGRREVGKLG